jgi:hypothetical protein
MGLLGESGMSSVTLVYGNTNEREMPWLLIALALFAPAAWGVVTYAAVRLAIVSASRVTRTAGA